MKGGTEHDLVEMLDGERMGPVIREWVGLLAAHRMEFASLPTRDLAGGTITYMRRELARIGLIYVGKDSRRRVVAELTGLGRAWAIERGLLEDTAEAFSRGRESS